jgi:predicted RNA binding protein YcfA (HicA-like mRNA interferase family)
VQYTVGRHGNKEVPKGILDSILKSAGIKESIVQKKTKR